MTSGGAHSFEEEGRGGYAILLKVSQAGARLFGMDDIGYLPASDKPGLKHDSEDVNMISYPPFWGGNV